MQKRFNFYIYFDKYTKNFLNMKNFEKELAFYIIMMYNIKYKNKYIVGGF